MPHFRVDDALHSHPKARQAGLEAMGLWNMCGSYCMGYLTDGFVPEWYVKTWPKGVTLAKRLVVAKMWTPVERDGEKGWQFHEFTGPGRNDSRAQIEESRKKWRDKKAVQRGDSPQVSPVDTKGDTPRDSLRVTRDPTQPNPTEDFSGYVSLSATEPDSAGGIAATPGADLVREIIPAGHPAAVLTGLRVRASELIRQGHTRTDVAAALELWLTKPSLGPNVLPSLLSEVIKTRALPNGGRSPTDKTRAWAEFAAEERALELAETATARKELS